MISLIVAHTRNRVIGRDGGLPWSLPGDLRRFKELTTGHTVLMGRATYESLPERFRPLPGRRNLVLSSDPAFAAPGAEVFPSLQAAFAACAGEHCFVIGGGATYAQALAYADEVLATEIDVEIDGDTHFPPLAGDWRCVEAGEPVAENGHAYVFRRYVRA